MIPWPFLHWLAIHVGAENEPGVWYGFFSGAGSDLAELAIIGAMIGILRKHNCEVRGCWRLGRHDTAAGHSVCRKHHPDGHLTDQDVINAHHAALGSSESGESGERMQRQEEAS